MMRKAMLVGLVGSNIGSSLSPVLHEDAFAAAGIAGHYHLMDVNRLKSRQLEDLHRFPVYAHVDFVFLVQAADVLHVA